MEERIKKALKGLGALVIGMIIGATAITIAQEGLLETKAVDPKEIVEKKNKEEAEKKEKLEKQENKKKDDKKKENKHDNKKVSTKTNNNKEKAESQNVEINESNKQKESVKEDVIITKTTTSKESILFKTIEEKDSTLEKGETKVVQEGKNGTKTITYKETYKNGSLVSKEVVNSEITQQPTSRVIKVGTKEQSTSKAATILKNAGYAVAGNQYSYITELSGVVVQVTLSNGEVKKISFDGTSYYTWKGISKELLIKELGEKEGNKEYKLLQQDMKKIEGAIRAAANAAGNSSLYNEILSGGASTNVYVKTF